MTTGNSVKELVLIPFNKKRFEKAQAKAFRQMMNLLGFVLGMRGILILLSPLWIKKEPK